MAQPSYARGADTPALLDETIGDNLHRTALEHGDRDALCVPHQGVRLTWTELDALARRAARGLMALGVNKGDRVGLWSPNRYEWVVIQYATAYAGAILVNLNPAYKSTELAYSLVHAQVSVLFTARAFRLSPFAEMVREVRDRCPHLREVLVLEDDWARLLAAGDAIPEHALEERRRSLCPDDAINIQYTSGTTGSPKGATLSHRNILNNGYMMGQWLRYTPDDRVCLPVPFYHCFGMVMGNLACSTHGACIVAPSEAFDPEAVLRAVAEERCTSLYGVPTMFIAVLDHPRFAEFDVSSLRTGIMAGSPCPTEVMKRVLTELHMPEVTIGYGMTETSPVSVQTAVDDPLDKRVGTVGRVHPHVEIKIVDPDSGAVLPRGQKGELCTRGYSVMRGYWENTDATADAIDAEGYMHSGDLATMDEAGYVNIVGRIKDMIIRGGENIYPREVEEYLHTHPAVSDVQIIGVPSAKYGEEVMAWLRLRPGMSTDETALDAYCRGQIATYKIPRYWKLVDEFPLTVTGKIQKYKLRELAIVELGLQSEAAIRTA